MAVCKNSTHLQTADSFLRTCPMTALPCVIATVYGSFVLLLLLLNSKCLYICTRWPQMQLYIEKPSIINRWLLYKRIQQFHTICSRIMMSSVWDLNKFAKFMTHQLPFVVNLPNVISTEVVWKYRLIPQRIQKNGKLRVLYVVRKLKVVSSQNEVVVKKVPTSAYNWFSVGLPLENLFDELAMCYICLSCIP